MTCTKLFAAALLLSTSAFAAAEVDVFLSSQQQLPVPGPLPEATARLVAGGRITATEPRLGVPTFFWAERQALAPDLRAQGLTPEHVARRALFTYAPLYRAVPAQLAEARLLELHDTGVGGVIARFEHRVDGLPVFHERLNVLLTQRLELVALSGAFSSLPWRHRDFKLGAPTALAVAADAFGARLDAAAFRPLGFDGAGALRFAVSSEQLRFGLVRAQQVLFPDVDGRQLVPAWYVELEGSSELLGTVVSALDGRVLWRRSLTQADAYQYRVWADPVTKRPLDGPNGRATPHPTGNNDGTTVSFVPPALISLEHAGLSTNDPWLGAGATETTGNNVEAYADLAAGDGFDAGVDVRGVVTAPGVFGDTFDPSLGPTGTAQRNAGIAQLFYTVNWLHDWFYDRGFNEAAGNAQALNFGRGGAEGDSIKAEAQDYGGLNNANMSTPTDGARPRMQMFNWSVRGSSLFTAAPIGLTLNPPGASFGPQTFDLMGTLVLGQDGAGVTTDACTALTNNVAGQLVLVDRGTCTFAVKAANVQAAGGIGMVVANNSATPPTTMGGTDPTITIGSQILTQADGNTLKTALLAGSVTVHLQRVTPPLRDGAVDNTVVAHEWGHYLSNRLVPGLGTQQARGMGEGWSDFVALLMTVEEADAQVASNANFGGVYALAVWDMDSTAAVTNAPYFGIRRVPYSVDFTKNALTFKHIADGEALPTHPLSAGGPNSEVHNAGEVWASALWEGYVALLRDSRFTFAQAQERMQRYLVAGLKLTPGNPTFTEARDGLLAAAAAQDLADYRVLASAFARRGMGLAAVSPPRDSTTDSPVVEDFSTGNDVAFVSATLTDDHPVEYCDRDGILDVGERGRLLLTLKNVGFAALTSTTATVTSDLPGVVITPSTLTFSSFDSFQTATASATVTLPASVTTRSALQLTLSFDDPSIRPAGPRTKTVAFTVHKDDVAASSASDDVEADLVAWSFTASPTTGALYRWQRSTVDPLNHRFFGVDAAAAADLSLMSPPLVVGPGPFSFTFSNRWAWEYSGSTAYDGAVLELSTDDGMTWTDIGASATPAYNGTLDNTSGNPLGGRAAWVNQSAGYPAFVTTTVNLGTTYAGQTVRVRLRAAADVNTVAVGWDVDDFAFTGLTNTPFPTVVADRGLCLNRPPVANAGADQTVDERTQVTLTWAGSTDPDGDLLTATWTQLAGPTVTLTNGSFTAPEVMADTTLRFSLMVNDGTVDATAADEVEVRVRQVNRAPVANAGMDLTLDERAPLNLRGTASDPDGDALTYTWRQVSGPTAQVVNANVATLVGVAPEVTANTPLVFELRVSDGTAVAVDTVTVTVRQVNRAPSAQAFADSFVAGGAAVTLTGFVVDPDGDATTVQWTQTAGPTVTLSSATALTPTFASPVVTSDTTMTFQLVASDGQLSSAPASVSLVVRGNNRGPIAEPGADVTVLAGESVQLDGSRSHDPEGSALTFAWQQEEEGSRLTLSGADTATPTVTAPLVKTKERLTVVLYVRDADGAVGHAAVHVTVEPKPASGCGCAGVSGLEPLLLLGAALLLRRRRS